MRGSALAIAHLSCGVFRGLAGRVRKGRRPHHTHTRWKQGMDGVEVRPPSIALRAVSSGMIVVCATLTSGPAVISAFTCNPLAARDLSLD